MAHWSFLIWVPVSSRTSAPATSPHHPCTPSAPAPASSCRFPNPAHSCLGTFAAAAPSSWGALPPVASPPVVSQPSSLKQQPSSLPAVFSPSPSQLQLSSVPHIMGAPGSRDICLSHTGLPHRTGWLSPHGEHQGAFCSGSAVSRCASSLSPPPLPPRRSWLFSGRVLPEEKGEAPATTGQTPILGMSIGSNWPSLVHRPTPETTALARGMWGSD